MLFLLSPAKTLDETNIPPAIPATVPALLKYSKQLIALLKVLSPQAIQDLMSVSAKIALLNAQRFDTFKTPFTPQNAKPAAFLFKGDVYQGLDSYNLSSAGLDYLAKHVGILSGLYGYLNALDLIQPYRLEMGTQLSNPKGKDLYHFWQDILTDHINLMLYKNNYTHVINLASNEYFSAIDPKKMKTTLITPIFKDQKSGQKNSPHKIISFYAKHARGLMVRFACEQQIDQPEGLKDFNLNGYYFKEVSAADPNQWIFLRDTPS